MPEQLLLADKRELINKPKEIYFFDEFSRVLNSPALTKTLNLARSMSYDIAKFIARCANETDYQKVFSSSLIEYLNESESRQLFDTLNIEDWESVLPFIPLYNDTLNREFVSFVVGNFYDKKLYRAIEEASDLASKRFIITYSDHLTD